MKILAIRGKNLASLTDKFEIDFQRGSLANAGLFAIYGPTGSGKSTILDALCVALFGETPRLASAGKSPPNIDHDHISPSDPRNLLRRNCAEAYAEVDFIAQDGIAYRAQWSVRRAYDKPTGKLQAATMSLMNLDSNQPVPGKNDEIKARIKDRLGLGFEQFRRSVLLAQNEFSVFLQSDENKRAELLETLTGLTICTAISKGAHQRAKKEREALAQIKAQYEKLVPLSPEDYNSYQQQLTDLQHQNGYCEQQRTKLRNAEQWHNQAQQLHIAAEQAGAALAKLQLAQRESQPRRKQLARLETVHAARHLIANRTSLENEINSQKRQLDAVQKELQQAQLRYQQINIELEKARAGRNQIQIEQEIAQPKLQQAHQLDQELERLTSEEQRSANQFSVIQADLARIIDELAQFQDEREKLRTKSDLIKEWRTENASFKVLAENWPRWDLLLANALKLQNELHQVLRTSYTKEREQKNAQGMLDQTEMEYLKAEQELQSVERKLKTLSHNIAQFNPDALASQRKKLEARRSQLDYAEKVANAITSTENRSLTLREEAIVITEKIRQCQSNIEQISAEQPAWNIRLTQIEQLSKTLTAACAENSEQMRAQLKSGEPCPVCGSKEHPYTTDAPQRALLTNLEEELEAVRKKVLELREQEIINQANMQNYHERLARISAEQEMQNIAQIRNINLWDEQSLVAEYPGQEQIARGEWIKDQLRVNRELFNKIVEQEDSLRLVQQESEKCRNLYEQKNQRYLAAKQDKQDAQLAWTQASANLKTARDNYLKLVQEFAEHQKDLDAAFPNQDWRSDWRANPHNFYAKQRENKQKWQDANDELIKSECQLQELNFNIGLYQNQLLPDRKSQFADAQNRYQKIQENLNNYRRQRQELFPGVDVISIKENLEQRLDQAERELELKEKTLKSGEISCIKLTAAFEQQRNNLALSSDKLDQANIELNNWISSCNAAHPEETLDIPQLYQLLDTPELKLQQEQAQLQKLDQQESNARAIYQERIKQCNEHDRERPESSLEEVQTQLEVIDKELKNINYHIQKIEKLLQQDYERTAAFTEMQKLNSDQEKQTTIWVQLDDVIGSNDGSRFRRDTQQLTLGVLVTYANLHLREFSQRYCLEQIPNTLAIIVIDQDMGHARRSVHSLSGGETFLVSLALALGLASLSAQQIRVESLFIDEGFGSLDAETLRVAMDALDNLQAHGRKVGVISHLREMTERIAVRINLHQQPGGRSKITVYG